MARRQHHNSVSLFPFLAVLVCAMGSLILLLLVMTRKIRQDQQASDNKQPSEVYVQANDRTEEIAVLNRQVSAGRAEIARLETEVRQLQEQLNSQQARLRSARGELQELQTVASDAEPAPSADTLAALLNEISTLRAEETKLLRQLTLTEKQLLAKQQQLTSAKAAVAKAEFELKEQHSALLSLRTRVRQAEDVQQETDGSELKLEFSNPTGTSRTPIAIDVSSQGFELLPNEILIRKEDMEGFPIRDNPLLAAVTTIHRYRSKDSISSEPYVLLLVRPDGSLPFYTAQRVLAEAGIHYGYELLLADQKIATEEGNAEEIPAVQAALNDAFQRRQNLYAKLMAIVEQHQDGMRSSGGSGSPERRTMAIRPDGRVVESDSRLANVLPGQFYAGGVAPPPSHYRNRASSRAASGTNPETLTPDEAAHLAEQFAAQYARQQMASSATQAGQNDPAKSEPGSAADPTRSMLSTADKPASAAASSGERIARADTLFRGDGSLHASKLLKEEPNRSATENSPITLEEAWLNSAATGAAGSGSGTGNESSPMTGMMPDLSRVDPSLLKQLPDTGKTSGSLSTPVGITVFLDERHMTIAQQRALLLDADRMNEAFSQLLTGIQTEVEDARRKPNEPLMPIVRFVVSPGGEKWRVPLSHGLKQTGIRFATVVELTPYITSADDTGRAVLEESGP